jgi:DNA-binding transcriptional ArsR family regulator
MALDVGIKTAFGNYGIKKFDTGISIDTGTKMTKAPEEPWEKRWNTFQTNPFAILKWFKTPTLDRIFRQLGEQAWYEWGLSENTPSTLTIGEIQKIGDPMRDIPVQSPMDVNTPGSWANLFAKAEGLRKFMEGLGMSSLQQTFQSSLGMGTIDIRLPDYSEVLKKLEERGKGIYETERRRILEDLSKMRELTYSDLNKLLGMDVWDQPIRQAEEIGRREAMRFMDVAGLGGLGAAPLLMSEIVQKFTQPLLVEKARGQQALMEMAQRGLLDQIALGQRGLQELGKGFTEYMYGLPFETFKQALKEAQFKYSTAFRLFDAQLEPYRIILGAQSRYTPPPGFIEDIATYFSAILPII